MSVTESKNFNYPILNAAGTGLLGSHMAVFCLENKVDIMVIDKIKKSPQLVCKINS